MIELEDIRNKWRAKNVSYSPEELDSIFSIKKGNIIKAFRTSISTDLIVAEILAIGFIILLQYLQLATSNFWSVMMIFLALQHLILYLLQINLIIKALVFRNEIRDSISSSIKRLSILLWHYRIWPPILSFGLYMLYWLLYPNDITLPWLIAGALIVISGVALISNVLSAVIVRKHLVKLKELELNLATNNSSE